MLSKSEVDLLGRARLSQVLERDTGKLLGVKKLGVMTTPLCHLQGRGQLIDM